MIHLTPKYNNCFKWPTIQFLQVLVRFSKKWDMCSASLEKHMCKLTHFSVCHPLLTYTYSGFIFILFYKATKRLDYMKHRLQDTSVWYKFLPCTQYSVQNLHDIQQASLLEKTPLLYISTFFFSHTMNNYY